MKMDKIKILIIEDDFNLAKLISNELTKNKYEVILATDADEGFFKAFKEKPDLIILDILLPDKSGFEFLKKIKKMSELKVIPVVILSNVGQDREIRLGLRLGAVDYLVKADFTINDLMKKIKKILEAK